MHRTHLIIFISTGWTETAPAAESNMLEFSAMRTAIENPALRVIAAVDHFVDILDNGSSRAQFIKDMFIVIGKNCLEDIFLIHDRIILQS